MRTFLKLSVIYFILFPFKTLFSQNNNLNTIAVIDFNSQDISNSANVILSNFVRKELINKGFIVVDRNNMQQILQEHGFQQTGLCNDLKCMIEVGQLLGVRKMIGGGIGKLGQKWIIDLQLVDVESGKIEKIVNENYVGPLEELDTPIISITNKLVGISYIEKVKTSFYIFSDPVGAKVFLNEELKGNSPIDIQIEKEGEYQIRVEADGYSEWQQKVQAKLNERVFINAKLIKKEAYLDKTLIKGMTEWEKTGMTESEWKYERDKKSVPLGMVLSLLPGGGHYYSKNLTTGILYSTIRTGTFILAYIYEDKSSYPYPSNEQEEKQLEDYDKLHSTYFTIFLITTAIDIIHAGINVNSFNAKLRNNYHLNTSLKLINNTILLGFDYNF